MNASKALLFTTSGLAGVWLIYSAISIRQDSAKLVIENAVLSSQATELASLQKEAGQLTPIRKALAGEVALRQERESRRKDQAEIAALEKRIADHQRKQEAELERVKQEVDLLKQKSSRGEPVGPANAWKAEALDLKLNPSNSRNQGASTPETLLETWLWTAHTGSSDARRKLQFIPEDANPEVLAGWQTQNIAAAEHQVFLTGVTSVVITERSLAGDGNEASLIAKLIRNRDPIEPESGFIQVRLIRSGNEWRIQSVGGKD